MGLGCGGFRPHIPLSLNFRFPARLPPDQIILKAECEGDSFPGQPSGTKNRREKSREQIQGRMMEDRYSFNYEKASLVAQMIKHLPAIWETRIRSLGWEDPLEKEMATHSSTLARKIPWTEEPGMLQSIGSQRVGHN